MEAEKLNPNNKKFKIIIIVLAVVIAVLGVFLIRTTTKVNVFTIEKEKTMAKNAELQHGLDSLLTEHDKIKKEYSLLSSQLSEKDSIILAKADEIQNLIATSADYYKIKRKLEYLRGITQGYIAQIDSLYKVNKELKDENVVISDKYTKEKVKTSELTKERQTLTEKVSLASTLKAYNIKGIPVRTKSGGKKEEVEEKAKRTDRIKITFTLSENLIATSGSKTIYLRIARPDDKILTSAEANTFTYNGESIQYSVKKDINYQNKVMDIVMYWDKIEDFTAGTYVISVFTDGYLIGESQFGLK